MEWLKEKGIRQTFTSAYDSQANGVAERWINLIKTKSTALLASRYLPHTLLVLCCGVGYSLLQQQGSWAETGVIVLSVHNNTVHESYTAHVAPATFSDKDRWFIKRDSKDPNKIVYVNDKGEITLEAPLVHLPTVEQKLPLKSSPLCRPSTCC